MEGWITIGVQRASVLYPNSCYNEPCYIEVQVYCLLDVYFWHWGDTTIYTPSVTCNVPKAFKRINTVLGSEKLLFVGPDQHLITVNSSVWSFLYLDSPIGNQ